MKKVFCISAGQLVTKKKDHEIHRQNRYLNYGLLSLASIIKKNGVDAYQIQGNFESPETTYKIAVEKGIEETTLPLLLSIPSFYAISWANEFLEIFKSNNPNIKIIVGGRWVIDDEVEKMKKLMPLVDIIVGGLGEDKILKLLNIDDKRTNIVLHSVLDYTLLHDRALYQPSIEIARGCGMGCSFCQEKEEPLSKFKSGSDICHEARNTILQDDLIPMNAYLESSIFIPNKKWIDSLLFNRDTSNQNFKWRTEARVDSIKPRFMKELKKCGLEVIDLGLESADKEQLLRMQKTKNPELYLQRASELIHSAYNAGVRVKVNILLFAGESERSIDNTMKWLDQHKTLITGVSVGPVILFGWPHKTASYLDELHNYGASSSHEAVLGAKHINLSKEIDYEKSIQLSKKIGQTYTTASNYFFLKSFSYFSREYTYDKFLAEALRLEDSLNFKITSNCKNILG